MPYDQRLLASRLENGLAYRLKEDVQKRIAKENASQKRYVRGYTAHSIIKAIQVTGSLQPASGRQSILAFVGPTRVGKSTTIAKLAAHFALSPTGLVFTQLDEGSTHGILFLAC